ncbi:adenylosuccinate synthase [Pumilibacter muris]|uniref:adenylosuccinate synthase n=1 Tax=Pumilibacter muris TaxID=2941510 RepID=UPI0020413F04|nr:adenylosuccinate synthase [Pumilibacter muris]
MAVTALVGAQWGDEGKGKIIDILAEKSDMVVRAQGGNNAGHTVVANGITYKLRLIPSGILYKNTVCVIGNGVVVDPAVILSEMADLTSKGIDVSRLKIDARAHVIFPYHIALDELGEKARGAGDIGTTKRGIGPCYMDKAERIGIRMCDLINPEVFKQKLERNVKFKNEIITKIYGGEPVSFEKILSDYNGYAAKLAPHVCDTSVLVYDAVKSGKNVLMEGAQGALLDLDVGTYPYVTSSHPISGGFCVGAGIGPTLIKDCIGIAKAYTTRVGKGPFPTELDDEIGERIRNVGAEFGTVTGRPRRCGWLDAVILRFAVRVNGLTGIALNKLDTLTGLEKLKVCVSYTKNGKTLKDFPSDISELEGCEPVYEEFDGWTEDISAAKSIKDLPKNAVAYLRAVEKFVDCKIKMVGVGPDRTQNFEI